MTRPAGSSAAKAVKVTERMRERGVQALSWLNFEACASCGGAIATNGQTTWCTGLCNDFKEGK